MEFIFDLLKKLIKIFILYIVIGFVAMIIISFCGVFESLMINKVVGEMALSEYIILFGYAEVLWLPLVIGILFSKVVYFPNPMIKIILAIIAVAFLIGTIAIASKE